MHPTPADTPHRTCETVSSPLESPIASDESASDLSMNGVSQAFADAAVARSHAMFNRVLAGWASDVLRMERRNRIKRQRAADEAIDHRAAA